MSSDQQLLQGISVVWGKQIACETNQIDRLRAAVYGAQARADLRPPNIAWLLANTTSEIVVLRPRTPP